MVPLVACAHTVLARPKVTDPMASVSALRWKRFLRSSEPRDVPFISVLPNREIQVSRLDTAIVCRFTASAACNPGCDRDKPALLRHAFENTQRPAKTTNEKTSTRHSWGLWFLQADS